jgi:hypothetical protein
MNLSIKEMRAFFLGFCSSSDPLSRRKIPGNYCYKKFKEPVAGAKYISIVAANNLFSSRGDISFSGGRGKEAITVVAATGAAKWLQTIHVRSDGTSISSNFTAAPMIPVSAQRYLTGVAMIQLTKPKIFHFRRDGINISSATSYR